MVTHDSKNDLPLPFQNTMFQVVISQSSHFSKHLMLKYIICEFRADHFLTFFDMNNALEVSLEGDRISVPIYIDTCLSLF